MHIHLIITEVNVLTFRQIRKIYIFAFIIVCYFYVSSYNGI